MAGNDVNEDDVRRPKACPACRSIDLTTSSKNVTVTTYWRCLRCGEVWNEKRVGGGGYAPRRW